MGRNGVDLRKSDRRKCGKRKCGKRKAEGAYGNVRRLKSYMAVWLIIASVVIIAFFTPQAIFWIQDGVLHQRTELDQRERMDVETLSSGYEKSLYQRMLNFAEGLALGDSFYVTSRNLAANGETEELEEYLYSGHLYQGMMEHMEALDLIPMTLFKSEYAVSQWKQYVVYSDNYTKGVNFILWYIELAYSNDIEVKLLADAETGTLYALKIQGCKWMRISDYADAKYAWMFESGNMTDLWLICASQFEAISSETDLMELATGSTGTESDGGLEENKEDLYEEERILAMMEAHGIADAAADLQVFQKEEAYIAIMAYIEDRIECNFEERFVRLRLPYKAAALEITVEIGEWQADEERLSYMYPDITVGVRQLYEMIPEF